MTDDFSGHKNNIKDFLSLVSNRKDNKYWKAIGIALKKLAQKRSYHPLVIFLRRISSYDLDELALLKTLQQYVTAQDVRIVVTTEEPLEYDVGTNIKVERFSEMECRAIIDMVFILPRAAETLIEQLVEKSELIPQNLTSLLQQLLGCHEDFLDFNELVGVHLRQPDVLDEMPTALVPYETKRAQLSKVPETVLACIASDMVFSTDRISSVLRDMRKTLSEEELQDALHECQRNKWLKRHGTELKCASATIRRALEAAVEPYLLQSVHQAIYESSQKQGRPAYECFPHLLQAPTDFIWQRGEELIDGLRKLVSVGSFGLATTQLRRFEQEPPQVKWSYDLDSPHIVWQKKVIAVTIKLPFVEIKEFQLPI